MSAASQVAPRGFSAVAEVRRMIGALNAGLLEEAMAHLAPNVELEAKPWIERPFRGLSEVREFLSTLLVSLEGLLILMKEAQVVGEEVVAVVDLFASMQGPNPLPGDLSSWHDGAKLAWSGLLRFTFDRSGYVRRVVVRSDPISPGPPLRS